MEKVLLITEISRDELVNLFSDIKVELRKLNSTKSDTPEFYSREEASEMLKTSLTTLNTWTKSGLIKAHRLGGRVYYKHVEIINAMKEIKGSQRR